MTEEVSVCVFWGSKRFDIAVDPRAPVLALMEKLREATGVTTARQILMMRRRALKPDDMWATELVSGARIMMIGTADVATETADILSDEADPTESEDVDSALLMTGLKNLGNTCYLNSIFQVMRLLPDFANVLATAKKSAVDGARQSNDDLESSVVKPVSAEKQGLDDLELEDQPVPQEKESTAPAEVDTFGSVFIDFITAFPGSLAQVVKLLRLADQRFAERDEAGNYVQQDAAEAWDVIMRILKDSVAAEAVKMFEIEFEATMEDTTTKEKTVTREIEDCLRCVIDANTKNVEQGIQMTDVLGEKGGAQLTVRKEIVKLPKYLRIHMMRFDYKTYDGVGAKIVRFVEHADLLDSLPWLGGDLRRQCVETRELNRSREVENAGFYKLKALVTHRGRTPASGHYVSFVRVDDQWIRYDDQKVKEVDDEAIQCLYGGADWDCSYLLIYEAV